VVQENSEQVKIQTLTLLPVSNVPSVTAESTAQVTTQLLISVTFVQVDFHNQIQEQLTVCHVLRAPCNQNLLLPTAIAVQLGGTATLQVA
jgi:hypothetical protein